MGDRNISVEVAKRNTTRRWMPFAYNDGGRARAGYKGEAGDCVCRAIAIASGKPYREIYDALAAGNELQRTSKLTGKRSRRSARYGIDTRRQWFRDYMHARGFRWVPCMLIGSGCKVHLAPGELPSGRLVVSVSRHYVAVIDGTMHDIRDPSRGGRRCVYGFWVLEAVS